MTNRARLFHLSRVLFGTRSWTPQVQAKTSKADYDRLADAQSALAAVGMAPTPVPTER